MPDKKPDIVDDPLLSYGRDDPESQKTTKGHQHGTADAASGGADSSPLENEPAQDRGARPGSGVAGHAGPKPAAEVARPGRFGIDAASPPPPP